MQLVSSSCSLDPVFFVVFQHLHAHTPTDRPIKKHFLQLVSSRRGPRRSCSRLAACVSHAGNNKTQKRRTTKSWRPPRRQRARRGRAPSESSRLAVAVARGHTTARAQNNRTHAGTQQRSENDAPPEAGWRPPRRPSRRVPSQSSPGRERAREALGDTRRRWVFPEQPGDTRSVSNLVIRGRFGDDPQVPLANFWGAGWTRFFLQLLERLETDEIRPGASKRRYYSLR